jgi:hypothetical protein
MGPANGNASGSALTFEAAWGASAFATFGREPEPDRLLVGHLPRAEP